MFISRQLRGAMRKTAVDLIQFSFKQKARIWPVVRIHNLAGPCSGAICVGSAGEKFCGSRKEVRPSST
jgi:hypothetical protein